MENFIVSARKYRPATFDTVVGQSSITTTLKNAIRSNQLAQAFLFCGPRGVGKTTCARILAKTINCENISENIEPCNTCKPCLSFNTYASFNIHELDAASNNSVDDIRNLVDQVRIPPQIGKYKVYIIDEVHMLSQSAFNAFLKTLEEPPHYAKFILATTEKHRIIPTILSRCQIFDFKRISVEDIASQLAYVAKNENVKADADALHIIAQKADGAMRDALSMFDQIVSFAGNDLTYELVIQNLNVLDYDYYFKVVDYILTGDIPQSLLTLNEIIDNGFDGQHFLTGLGEHLRNLLVCRDPGTVKLLEVGASIRNRYLEQSGQCPVDLLLKALDITNKADINYKSSNNKRLHLEIALMQMCSILQLKETGTRKQESYAVIPETKKEEKPASRESVLSVAKENPPPRSTPSGPGTDNNKSQKSYNKGSGVSIKEMMESSRNTHSESQNNQAASATLVEKQAALFSQDELETEWNSFSDQLKENNTILYTTLTRRKPLLKEGFIIEFAIDNKVQEDEIRKSGLLITLRKQLKNDHIQISTMMNNDNHDLKPYTPMEKFKKMAEKNPDIINFKDKLDLEVDF